jgi:hypothetical protein
VAQHEAKVLVKEKGKREERKERTAALSKVMR